MNIINKYVNEAINKVVSKVNTAVSSMDISGEKKNLSLTTTIDDFRNKLNAGGGPARTNQFAISFEVPTFMNESKMLGYLGVTQFNEELGILCYKASAPEKKFNTVKVKYENHIERDIPVSYSWDTMTFSFIERKDYLLYNLFNEWLNGMHNPVTNTGRFYNEITTDVKINFLNKDNQVMAYYTLMEAKPVSMTMSELTWETDDQYVSIDVDFSFVYPMNKDYELTSLVNSVMDFGSSDVVNTIKDTINTTWKGLPSAIKKIGNMF